MIVDNTLVFSNSQAVTADAGSTNNLDIGAAGTAYGHSAPVKRDIGIGSDIPLWISVTEAFNNLTSLTLVLQTDDTAAFSSPKEVASKTYAAAELTLGARLKFPSSLPEGTDEQYLRLYYDVTGTAPSTGKIFAAVVAGAQTN
ncbi:Bbp16 family capsid cement protein [Sphingomonas turrisvirgatae]|uniref:Uncharacterized protein n=1 Tax=Sphingomonas turrisvirgatae TaxID=1888892 RepID=A0A1E3M2H2_9SPHN|nr:hypothetical protein [Sphingomonas turrisvirgatae]ODP39260.1 hypothetical protein BFL28_10630 [Sphingomonas turrisvirgatae]